MAEAGIMREFLVSLGFKVDEKSLKGFRDGVESATRAVQRLSVTVAAAATAMTAGVTVLASRLERLDFTSNRVKASASNLKALEQTAKNFGIEAQAAMGSVEALAKSLRNNPGVEAYAQSLGVRTREANGDLRDRVEILTDLSKAIAHMPDHLRDRFATMFGIDPEFARQMADPKFAEEQERRMQFLKDSGFEQAADDARGFMRAIRELGWRFELLSLQVQGALIKKLGPALDRLMKGIEKHGPQMAAKLADVAERLLDAVILLAPYLGGLIDKFLELDEATGGWSTSLLAVLAVARALGGGAIVGGIMQLAGAMRALGGAALGAAFAAGGAKGAKGAGLRGLLGRAGGWGLAAAGAWWLGEKIYDEAKDGGFDELMARFAAYFGSEEAQQALQSSGKMAPGARAVMLADTPLGKKIAQAEGDYNIVNTGEKHGKKAARVPLETMTLDAVMQAQREKRFVAAGRYQVIPSTLREAKAALGLNGADLFDRRMQDQIFEEYLAGLKRPALFDFLHSLVPITPETEFAALRDLSKEWASFPDPSTGKTYHNDGFNKARYSVDESRKFLLETRAMLGGSAIGGMNQTNNLNISVTGAQSPEATGRAVAEQVIYQEENLARTMPGVAY